jgi:hypothetical protein
MTEYSMIVENHTKDSALFIHQFPNCEPVHKRCFLYNKLSKEISCYYSLEDLKAGNHIFKVSLIGMYYLSETWKPFVEQIIKFHLT